jgi:predicted ATPase
MEIVSAEATDDVENSGCRATVISSRFSGYPAATVIFGREMLKSLAFSNFKPWTGATRIDLGAITGLFGTNSSGKTSILQTLLVLKQTAESLDRSRVLHLGDDRSIVDLGTFYDVISNHDTNLQMSFGLDWSTPEALVVNDPERKDAVVLSGGDLSFRTDLRLFDKGELAQLGVERFSYNFSGATFGMVRRTDEDTYDVLSHGYHLKRRRGRSWPLPAPIKSYAFPDQVTNYFQNADFVGDLSLALERLLTEVAYVGPLREYPHRTYLWGGERPSSVGVRGEQAVEALLTARAEDRKIGRGIGRGRRYVRFETRIAEWLKEMGLIESFAVRPIARNRKEYEVRVKRSAGAPEVLIPDVGFGVSQVLPVLVQCYFAPEGSIIVFEQPEIHLHPRVQAALADVFIDAAKERRVQIVVESHSEHLLRRLQRRVAEAESVTNEDIALYFVETRRDSSASELQKLEIDLFGNITNWPAGFFGDELGELAAMAAAAARRGD